MTADAREREFQAVRDRITDWAQVDEDILAVLLVGSWARGQARADSDIDVVVLTESTDFIDTKDWVGLLAEEAQLVRTQDWGAITERRVRLISGLEIEIGFGKPSWASTDPVDAGTQRVVTDGSAIWYDPSGVLSRLRASLGLGET